jgi:hypothetical protein
MKNDTVTLVVTTAALPLLSKPMIVRGGKGGLSSTTAGQQLTSGTMSTTTTTTTTNQQQQQQQVSALDAMWTSLGACSTSNMIPYNNIMDNTNVIEFLSSSVELPSQGQQSLVSLGASTTITSNSYSNKNGQRAGPSSNTSSSSSTTTALDGLVLCFVTSRNTQLIHCFDVTIRCNPPLFLSSPQERVSAATSNNENNNDNITNRNTTTSTGNDENTTATANSTTKDQQRNSSSLEDMDGWDILHHFHPKL